MKRFHEILDNYGLKLMEVGTNHLDAESVAWLERFLHDFEGTVVASFQICPKLLITIYLNTLRITK